MERTSHKCDLWVSHNAVSEQTRLLLKSVLDKRRAKLQDYTVPMYENIIDPNLLVDHTDRWVACDWDIEEIPNSELVEALQDVYVADRCCVLCSMYSD
jgi:hypothetical protein